MKNIILLSTILLISSSLFGQSKYVTKWNPNTRSYETVYIEDMYEKRDRERREQAQKDELRRQASDKEFDETMQMYLNNASQQEARNEQIVYENKRRLQNLIVILMSRVNYLKQNCTFTPEMENIYNQYLNSRKFIRFLDQNEVITAEARINYYISYFSNFPCNQD